MIFYKLTNHIQVHKTNTIFLIFTLILINISCGQSKKRIITISKTKEDIRNIYKEVNHFPKEPHYGIYISASNVNFEVRVNDKPVFLGYQFITNGIFPKGSYLPINIAISKTGIQTIDVRMYPAYNRETEQLETSLKNAQVEIDVVKREYDTFKKEYGDEEVLLSLAAPTEKNKTSKKIKFIYPKRTEYIFNGTFEAFVPYDIKVLDNAEVLLTTDPEKIKELTEQLLVKYNELWQIYDKDNILKYTDLIYDKEKRTAQQLFFTKSDSDKRVEDVLESGKIVEENHKMMPFKDYKLRFYANGRIVTLVYDKVGQVGRNKSVLRSSGNSTRTSYYTQFYKPKGSNQFILY